MRREGILRMREIKTRKKRGLKLERRKRKIEKEREKEGGKWKESKRKSSARICIPTTCPRSKQCTFLDIIQIFMDMQTESCLWGGREQ
jgi:ethanolamine ammonia-lyase small subunit